MLAPDFVDHSLLPGQEPGREGYMRTVAKDPAAFSNSRYIIEDQIAEGDKVMTRITVSRTHDRGEFMGVAPTGREVNYESYRHPPHSRGARSPRSGARSSGL